MYTNRPIPTQETAGTKSYCTCGMSANKPYCDGSHAGTGKSPLTASLKKPRLLMICDCGKSGTMPICDGAHSK